MPALPPSATVRVLYSVCCWLLLSDLQVPLRRVRLLVSYILPDCPDGVGLGEMGKPKKTEMEKPKKTEMQKQKKREIDRRWRLKKKQAKVETGNELGMAMIENKKLKSTVETLEQEIIQLTNRLNSIELKPDTTYGELWQEMDLLRIEKELIHCLLKKPNTSYIIMAKILQENEELIRTKESYKALIAG